MTTAASRRIALLIGFTALASLGAGCDPIGLFKEQAEKAKQEAETRTIGALADSAMQQVTGGRVGMDAKGGQITFTDKQSGASYRVGENVEVPKDFPVEMYVYPRSKVLAITAGDTQTMSLKAEEAADVVVSWYAEKYRLAGWKETSKLAVNGYEKRGYGKDGISLTVTFLGSRDSGSKSTVVSLERKKSP